jgi:hypothetical protein
LGSFIRQKTNCVLLSLQNKCSMGFSIKSKQIAFRKLGNIHYTFKILFFLLQPYHSSWRRGCVVYPLLVATFSWLISWYCIFIA